VPTDPSADITVDNLPGAPAEAPAFSVGLPDEVGLTKQGEVASDGTVGFEGSQSASTAVQVLADSIRIATVIDNSTASKTYTYDLPDGVEPVVNADGSVALQARVVAPDAEADGLTEATVVFGSVAAPWAIDSTEAAVPTHYEADNGKLVQVVGFSDDTSFPVVADPRFWWGWNIFISNSQHAQIFKVLAVGASTAVLAATILRAIPGINVYIGSGATIAAALIAVGVTLWNACNLGGAV